MPLLTPLTWRTTGGCSRIRRRFFAAVIAWLLAANLNASSQVKVTEDAGVYTVSAWFTVPQTPSAAFAVLTDYENLPRFMPGLKKSVLVERSASTVILEQDAVAKFLTFSKNIHLRLQTVEQDHTLHFKDTSSKSFSQYEGSWRISTRGAETLITYDLTANPSFAVPQFLLRRLLSRDADHMIDALQKEMAARSK